MKKDYEKNKLRYNLIMLVNFVISILLQKLLKINV